MIEAAAANQPDTPLRLAELLCERLCHDLSSQLGSLAGAVELAVDDPVERDRGVVGCDGLRNRAHSPVATAPGGLGRRLRRAFTG